MTKSQVRNLGIILDLDLNFNSHIKSVTSSVYYHLKNTARVREIMSKQNLVRLTHAFISSRLDYCNGLFTGLPEKLHGNSNLFTTPLPGSWLKLGNMTTLRQFWLPVTQTIDFKILLLVYKSLCGSVQIHLTQLCDMNFLGSLTHLGLAYWLSQEFEQNTVKTAFCYHATQTWNNLPDD